MKTKLLLSLFFYFTSVFFVLADSEIVIYDNAPVFFPNTTTSWPGSGSVDFNSTDSPYSGNYCIKWIPGGTYTDWALQNWPPQDLIEKTTYSLEYYYKTTYSGAVWLKWQFISNIGEDPWTQYFNTFTTQNDWISDGAWHKVSIPLSSFSSDAGFSWAMVEKFRIATDWDASLAGQTFYFDEIKLVPQTTTKLDNVQNGAIKVNVFPNSIKINVGEAQGKLVIYNLQGEIVKDFGLVKSNSIMQWNNCNLKGIYIIKIFGTNESIKLSMN